MKFEYLKALNKETQMMKSKIKLIYSPIDKT